MPYLSDVLTESTEQQKKQFFVTSVLLVALAALLRFYHLGDIPGPVFDEVYFPEYGYSYLLGKEFFHVHPPLYNYISTASIWLYHQLPWVDIAPLGSVEFKNLQAISYRWINAVVGTALVAITIALVFRLTKVKTAALIAGAFVAIDGSIVVDDQFATADPSIYALGDVIDRVQLTPVAIQEAMVLVDHLYGDGTARIDYSDIPTAVFCQPEFGTVGLSEEQARAEYSAVDVYLSDFKPMLQTLGGGADRVTMKLVVDRTTDRVLGCHMVGEHAAEIIQGLGIALKAGATKAHFDATVGIHPSAAEEFVTMRTKAR